MKSIMGRVDSRHFPHAIALTQQIGPFTLKFDSKLAIDVKQMRRHKYCNSCFKLYQFLALHEHALQAHRLLWAALVDRWKA